MMISANMLMMNQNDDQDQSLVRSMMNYDHDVGQSDYVYDVYE